MGAAYCQDLCKCKQNAEKVIDVEILNKYKDQTKEVTLDNGCINHNDYNNDKKTADNKINNENKLNNDNNNNKHNANLLKTEENSPKKKEIHSSRQLIESIELQKEMGIESLDNNNPKQAENQINKDENTNKNEVKVNESYSQYTNQNKTDQINPQSDTSHKNQQDLQNVNSNPISNKNQDSNPYFLSNPIKHKPPNSTKLLTQFGKPREKLSKFNNLDCAYTILISGPPQSGKTSFILRYCEGKYNDTYVPSVNDEISYKSSFMNSKIYNFKFIATNDIMDADCILILFDLSSKKSYDLAYEFISGKLNECQAQKFLIGNKNDLFIKDVEQDVIDKFCLEYNCKYFEISVKKNYGIIKLMQNISSILDKKTMSTKA